MNYDAFARLNIARKLIDNIAPGMGQLGGTWLPFPQLLFLPFIWNDFLWHSGLAGAFISTTSFVMGAIFLEKTVFMITKSLKASLVTWLIYVTNLNLLLFQTSAMSESFFICSIIMVIYCLTKWSKSQKTVDLLSAALWVMISTLIRYEGWFVLIGSVITVFSIVVINYGKKNKAFVEGTVILFMNIAAFGILLWFAYCAIFFKNPFYWLDYYTESSTVVSVAADEAGKKVSLLQAFLTYSQASLWMNGLIISLPGIIGYLSLTIAIFSMLIKNKEKLTNYLSLFIICNVLFLLLIYGYSKGYIPQLMHPEINSSSIFDRSQNIYTNWKGPNIRYGLIMMPFFSLLGGFLVARSRILFVVTLMLIIMQHYVNVTPPYYLQFSITKASKYIDLEPAAWIRTNYEQGLILISARRHEDLIFQTNLPYKSFIHEGTRAYWRDSLKNPAKYATWLIYNDNPAEEDRMPYLLSEQAYKILGERFQLVYEDNKGYKIYKRI